MKDRSHSIITFSDRATGALGSNASLVVHTIIFAACFVAIFAGADADRVLLLLTTVVSLEAIYLSLFIQISVNRNTSDIAEIQDDIEEIAEDVEDIAEDVESIEKDIDEIAEDVETIGKDIDEIQEDMESIEKEIDEIAEDVEGIEKDIEEIAEDVEDIAEEYEEDDTNPITQVGKTSMTQLAYNNATQDTLSQIMNELRELKNQIGKMQKD